MIKSPLSLFATGALLLLAVQSATAAVNFVGVSVPWIEGQSGDLPRRTDADTVGGNPGWNAYLRPTGGSFVNSGNGASTRFSLELQPGDNNFEAVLQTSSWVDGSPNSPGSYLNVFLDDRANPAISAQLAGGNSGDLAALSVGDVPGGVVVNDAGGLAAPAGSLSWSNGEEIVSLTSMSFGVIGDSVGAFSEFPSGLGDDSLISFTLNVVPEPSSTLLLLLGGSFAFARRRRS
jgi:hypothetical protein